MLLHKNCFLGRFGSFDPSLPDGLIRSTQRTQKGRGMYELTQYQASLVKRMRNHLGYSWRRISEAMAKDFPDLELIPGNQIEGKELCQAAGIALGEDWRVWDER